MTKYLIETMPDHLRASHRAARNWGTYPHNGAERRVVDESELPDLEDEYDHVVREVTDPEDREVANAISRSKATNETVELDAKSEYAETLSAECDGHDDNGTYWGADCDGNEWQVRLVERDTSPWNWDPGASEARRDR